MKVSVVMPVYNSERYLKEAIDSILNQTYRDFELIIVNDGSKDNSKEILDEIKDARVKVIHSEQNNGAAKSLNIGINLASNDWIFIHDSDDISYPTRIEEQVKRIQSQPDLVLICTKIECFSDSQNIDWDKARAQEAYHNKLNSGKEIMDIRFHGCPIMHGTVAFSKKAFNIAGGYNPTYKIAYDYDLWLRLFQLGPIDIVPNVLYRYRIHEHSLSHTDWLATINEVNIISTKYIRELLRSKIGHEPVFIIMGPKKGVENFRRLIAPANKLKVMKYFTDHLEENCSYCIKKIAKDKAHAVIILDNYYSVESAKAFEKLIKNRLSKNVNLFTNDNILV
ncbi:glycosyltransferase [Bacillus sp. 1P10SD]|uniref:glycosyltransferase family 2 protein n=1 Tax=Bacillus sp. 1P10SD TaxID=3132265 RepID=UPI0039A66054